MNTIMLGTAHGRYVVMNHSNDQWIGRWDTYDDASAHVGEHCAMDPEADLGIYDLAETPC
jgi:hypothetical protein